MEFQRLLASAFATAAAVLSSASIAPSAHADTIWHSDWMGSTPTHVDEDSSSPSPSTVLAFGASADLLIGGAMQTPYVQFTRLSADGALRWTTNLGTGTSGNTNAKAMLATADGGAYVALAWNWNDAADLLVRVDSSGARLWSRRVPSGWLLQSGTDRIVSMSCRWLTVMDAASGNVIWQRRIDANYDECVSGGVVADAQGNLYASFDKRIDLATSGFHTIKFDTNGTKIWDIPVANASGATVVGMGNTLVYELTSTQLRGVRVGDGSVAWSVAMSGSSGAKVLVTEDSAREPVIIESSAVRRIAADTGTARWTQTLDNYPRVAALVNGTIMTMAADGFTRLDAASGAIAWESAVPLQDAAGNSLNWIGMGAAHNGHFLAVALPFAGPKGNRPPFLQSIDFASGVLSGVVPVPAVARGMSDASIVDDSGNVVSFGVDWLATAVELRMRRLNAATGAVAGESVDTIGEDLGAGIGFLPSPPQVAAVGGNAAVAMALNAGNDGGSRIALYDRANGQRLWRTFLHTLDQGRTDVSTPVADASGNVYVAASAEFLCGSSYACRRNSLYKLAAADGAELWHVNDDGDQLYSPVPGFTLVGSDVLLGGPFAFSTNTLRRLSGSNGSILWSSNEFSGSDVNISVHKIDDGHVVVFGLTSTSMSWAKLDTGTGATLWTHSIARAACHAGCMDTGELLLPGGDVLFSGERDYRAVLRRFHDDGSGVVDEWALAPADPARASWTLQPQADSSGLVRLILRQGLRNSPARSVHFITRFDPATGSLSGQQALVAFNEDPYNQTTYPAVLRETAPNRLLVDTFSVQAPLPPTASVALLDTSVTVHGDLSVETSIDRSHVMQGSTVHFHVKVSYTGDQPLLGARLHGSLPWPSGITAATCTTQAASNCAVTTLSGNLDAR
ncbi:MAG: PQQ-binding-like beta-propeller repeat protein, partial [Dokdonella sp.]